MRMLILGFLLTWRLIDVDSRYWLITDDGNITEIAIDFESETEVI